MPSTMLGIRREHVESRVENLLVRHSSATAHNRYRGLRSFFEWCVDEGEIKSDQNPMARTRPPKMDMKVVPLIQSDALERLLKACSGQEFDDRRDAALVHLFLSTGARKSEIGNLRWTQNDLDLCDLDLDRGLCRIVGKGSRQRVVDLTPATAKAIDRYLRLRANHVAAHFPWLWLGKRGRLTPSGCARAIESRARIAGLGKIHVHQLHHSYAHAWPRDGGSEESLMRLLGWKSREMLSRYAASAGEERARALNRRVGLGARF
ncbi:MAG: tyrosine-type recombinase/integrase [Chloroflexi bacterium]|nr:tyrosine-type recombinase/integrase [Chloroflexota bacterium]